MRTAQTIQLLDANNNNISPAVCIDSLYFEGAIGTDTYRFALRDRIIVGSEDLTSGELPVIPPSADSILLPTLIVEELKGSGIWQLKPAQTDVTTSMKSFISQICEGVYVQNSSLSDNYLDLLGNNRMKGAIKMSSGLKYTEDGVTSSNNRTYVDVSNGLAKVISNASIQIDAPDIVIGKTAANVSIGSQSSTIVSLTPKSLDLISANEQNIRSKNSTITIEAKNDISIFSDNGDVHIGKSNRSVYLHGSEININGAVFPTPTSSSTMMAFTADTNGVMSWKALGALDINGYDSQSGTKHIDFISQSQISATSVIFTNETEDGNTSTGYHILGDSNIKNIEFRHLKSGDKVERFDGSTAIHIKRINGESLLGNNNIELATKQQYDDLTKIEIQYSGLNAIACVNTASGKVSIMPSAVTIYDNVVYAEAFVMASDERLKTDIREDCFDNEMSPIHGFIMKDSSVRSYGFIAQELEQAGFDNLVYDAPDGTKRVDYMGALSYKVAQLERENKKLWAEIEKLKKEK